jgi:hypothetical protein
MTQLILRIKQVATPWLATLPFLLFPALPAQSTPLVLTLNNAVFNDGGQATGSFVYDDDTHNISYANITTTAGDRVQFNTSYNASMVDSRSTTSHLVFCKRQSKHRVDTNLPNARLATRGPGGRSTILQMLDGPVRQAG